MKQLGFWWFFVVVVVFLVFFFFFNLMADELLSWVDSKLLMVELISVS